MTDLTPMEAARKAWIEENGLYTDQYATYAAGYEAAQPKRGEQGVYDRMVAAEAERDRLAARVAELREYVNRDSEQIIALQSRLQQATEALRKIVLWDDNEKPHKNLPLSDVADLARRTLAALAGEDDGCGMAGCVREGKGSQQGECACVACEDDAQKPPQREGDYL